MKTKDIEKGVVYSKRGRGTSHWGVVVTTEKLYSFPKYSPDTSLYSGTGILVIVSRATIGKGTYGTPESAAAIAKKMEAPSFGNASVILDKLAKKGLGLEIWQPRDFEATMEDALSEREAERERDRKLRSERENTQSKLKNQFDRIQNDLGIQAQVSFNITDNRVAMSPREWSKLMDRVEALIQTSGPLSTGSL